MGITLWELWFAYEKYRYTEKRLGSLLILGAC